MLVGIIYTCRQYLEDNNWQSDVYYFTDGFLSLWSFIFVLYFIVKELIKKDYTLCYHKEIYIKCGKIQQMTILQRFHLSLLILYDITESNLPKTHSV